MRDVNLQSAEAFLAMADRLAGSQLRLTMMVCIESAKACREHAARISVMIGDLL
jgi:hypothetical protein